MKVSGYLTGLTPKDKTDSQVIEIRIVTKFDHDVLSDLAEYFGEYISAEISNQQRPLEFESKEEAGL